MYTLKIIKPLVKANGFICFIILKREQEFEGNPQTFIKKV
jgi:hypothetical protein